MITNSLSEIIFSIGKSLLQIKISMIQSNCLENNASGIDFVVIIFLIGEYIQFINRFINAFFLNVFK